MRFAKKKLGLGLLKSAIKKVSHAHPDKRMQMR